VSLSNDSVLRVLKTQFVCGFKNITGEPYAGKSGHHDTDSPAVVTTNGAGPHNVQLFFLSSDGVVLHCLPGYWAPQDLLLEMRFAQNQNQLWRNTSLSPAAREKRFKQANLTIVRQLPPDMLLRSHLQGFDAKHEEKKPTSDFRFKAGDYRPIYPMPKHANLKTTVQVVHERMAQRPFVPYGDFDVAEFSDYGKWRYDKKEESRVAGGMNAPQNGKK
jgi:hypothetical protein